MDNVRVFKYLYTLQLHTTRDGNNEIERQCSTHPSTNHVNIFARLNANLNPSLHIAVLAVFLLQALFAQTVALCPPRCHCNEGSLHVLCIDSGLDLVPILLNPELVQLNLTHNKITNLHYTLSFYNNLKVLDLSYNKVQTLGSMNFESQHQLIHLNISNNFVQNISRDTFKGLKHLEIMDLSYNELTNIMTSAFGDLKMLQVLYLNNNNLISFEPDLFAHVTKLRILVLNYNQILEVPTSIMVCTRQLERLELSHNLIKEIDDAAITDLTKLEYLAFDSNVISNISLTAFDELPNMQYLDLSDNNLYDVPTQQMSKLTNLTILKLSGNFIEQIEPLAFRSLFQLKTLYLSRMNRLYSIDSRAFVDNVNLESIWMDANPKLLSIPTRMFHGNAHIKHISIRNNVFSTLEPDHFPLDQLQSLRLSGSNFVCNCSLVWLWKLIKEDETFWFHNHSTLEKQVPISSNHQQDMLLDAKDVKCVAPPELQTIYLINVRESDIRCSGEWVTAITAIVLFIFVIAILASLISYKKCFKCLPDRRASNTASGALRHRSDISAPSLMGTTYPSTLYDGPHHIHRPKSTMTPTPWDITFQEQYSRSDFPSSPLPQIKQKPPHIVFV